jgi:hypothetical protein
MLIYSNFPLVNISVAGNYAGFHIGVVLFVMFFYYGLVKGLKNQIYKAIFF